MSVSVEFEMWEFSRHMFALSTVRCLSWQVQPFQMLLSLKNWPRNKALHSSHFMTHKPGIRGLGEARQRQLFSATQSRLSWEVWRLRFACCPGGRKHLGVSSWVWKLMLAVSWTAARLLVRTPTFATSGLSLRGGSSGVVSTAWQLGSRTGFPREPEKCVAFYG